MATKTGVQAFPRNDAVRANHTGIHMAVGSVSNDSTTKTASSVFLLCRVPHGATIVDYIFIADDAAADQTYQIGLVIPEGSTSGSATLSKSALSSDRSISLETNIRGLPSKLPVTVDVPDAALPQWAWVVAVNKLATSASQSLKIIVFYTMEDSTP